ncbi:MAG: tRNA adenylyl-/cytidylyl-transferase [Candidatus Levybacteria bacterium GW2011_GWA2_40_8]|nr:MAG: tRNA adenylyl-/cytidylyl-transferase [Candidatus Levybacteria bacterium GW2011_GWA2_40_8]
MKPVLPTQAFKIIKALQKEGYSCFAVGGSVRGLLLGRKTSGWDFTTSAKPEEILKIFPGGFYDNKFGTVGLPIEDDVFEITTFRTEKRYSDKRHPDKVQWGSTIEEDLKRRDFTINAIAFDGEKLIDPHGGITDLKKKIVRAVGDPNLRFSEDALRLIRAIRIATEIGFVVEKETANAIKANTRLLQNVSNERIRDELLKILRSNHPADGILLLKEHLLLLPILPELEIAFNIPQKSPKRHHIYDVGTHSVESLRNCKSTDPIVRLATLLHDIGKPKTFKKEKDGMVTFYNHEVEGTSMVINIAKRLRLSRKDTGRLILLVRWHQFSVDPSQTDATLRRFIKKVGKENLNDILALRTGDRLGGGAAETSWRLELFKKRLIEVQKQPFTVSDLKVNGHDVMNLLKIKPGPQIGKILNQLFEEVVEKKLENKKEILLQEIPKLA